MKKNTKQKAETLQFVFINSAKAFAGSDHVVHHLIWYALPDHGVLEELTK